MTTKHRCSEYARRNYHDVIDTMIRLGVVTWNAGRDYHNHVWDAYHAGKLGDED